MDSACTVVGWFGSLLGMFYYMLESFYGLSLLALGPLPSDVALAFARLLFALFVLSLLAPWFAILVWAGAGHARPESGYAHARIHGLLAAPMPR